MRWKILNTGMSFTSLCKFSCHFILAQHCCTESTLPTLRTTTCWNRTSFCTELESWHILSSPLDITMFGQSSWSTSLRCHGPTTLMDCFQSMRPSWQVGIGKFNIHTFFVTLPHQPLVWFFRLPKQMREQDPSLVKRFWWYVAIVAIPLTLGKMANLVTWNICTSL